MEEEAGQIKLFVLNQRGNEEEEEGGKTYSPYLQIITLPSPTISIRKVTCGHSHLIAATSSQLFVW